MRWKQRSAADDDEDDARGGASSTTIAVAAHTIPKSTSSSADTASSTAPASNLYFDYDTMKWQTRPSVPTVVPGDVSDLSSGPTSDGSELISDDSDDGEVDFFGTDSSHDGSEDDLDRLDAVSYTHLTLPTIYSV